MAIEGLEQLGISSRGAVPALVRALRDDDQMCRCLAALALSEIEGRDKGRARAMLAELADSPSLPPRVKKQVSWVLSANFVGVSKVSQPVHVLRFVVDEYRQVEAIAAIRTAGATEGEVTDPEP